MDKTNEKSNETYLGLTKDDFNLKSHTFRYAMPAEKYSQLDKMESKQERYSLKKLYRIPKWYKLVI